MTYQVHNYETGDILQAQSLNEMDAQIAANETAISGKQDPLTFDNVPTSGSNNPVKSSGIYAHTSNTSNPHSVTAAQVGLGNCNNTADLDKPISTATQTALSGKVDVISGKGLSENDYTTAEKTKLAGISAGAEVNVQSDWTQSDTTSDDYIKNKPFRTIGRGLTNIDGVLIANTFEVVEELGELPTPSSTYAHKLVVLADLSGRYGRYVCRNAGDFWEWVPVTDLSQSSAGISINGTSLQTASASQNGLLTSTDWSTFNGKQNALTFDNVPTEESTNPVRSWGIKQAIDTVAAGITVTDVTLNGSSVVSSKTAALTTIDNVTSAGNLNPLTANQGKLLNDRIDNLSSIGRFLSLWNCSTGLPTTNPETTPYTYKTGDYFRVSAVGATNYKPNGSSYTGAASTTTTSENVAVGDTWYYDGSVWMLEINHSAASVQDVTVAGTSVLSSGTAVIPAASASVTGALTSSDWSTFNAKQKAITISTSEPTAAEGNDGDIWMVYTP